MPLSALFETSQRITLDDGRALVVQYEGERHGWACVANFGYPVDETPTWVGQLSERLLRELAEAPRYLCQCCGVLTLLRHGEYAI